MMICSKITLFHGLAGTDGTVPMKLCLFFDIFGYAWGTHADM